jgi:hypothetical protein
LWLVPFIGLLISPCQSAFINKQSIHNNILYVRNLSRRFHRNKTPTFLFKLDISKAFDSMRWDYILSLYTIYSKMAKLDYGYAFHVHLTHDAQWCTARDYSSWAGSATRGPVVPTALHSSHRPTAVTATNCYRTGSPE